MTELEIKEQLKGFLCSDLGVDADALEFDTPLFGDGVGLDSIDSIEMISFIDVTKIGIKARNVSNIKPITAILAENGRFMYLFIFSMQGSNEDETTNAE